MTPAPGIEANLVLFAAMGTHHEHVRLGRTVAEREVVVVQGVEAGPVVLHST